MLNHRAFVEGRNAYREKTLLKCPYPEESSAAKAWQAGWDHEWYRENIDEMGL